MLVFARKPDEATAQLLRSLQEMVRARRSQQLFAWMVFLSPPDTQAQTALERQVFQFARSNGVTRLPLAVLGEEAGPPGYLISPEAHVTVLLLRKEEVLHNWAFRPQEWNPRSARGLLADLGRQLDRLGEKK